MLCFLAGFVEETYSPPQALKLQESFELYKLNPDYGEADMQTYNTLA